MNPFGGNRFNGQAMRDNQVFPQIDDFDHSPRLRILRAQSAMCPTNSGQFVSLIDTSAMLSGVYAATPVRAAARE